jgi:hypothetical protein
MWDEMYARLAEFRRREGHTRVPRDYLADRQLASWVRRQAYLGRNGQLWRDWECRLTALGFEFNLLEIEASDAMYKYLVAFRARHGHSRLEAASADHPHVAKWLQRQQRLAARGKLAAGWRERLEQLGVEFETPQDHRDGIWEEMYARLVAFHQQHGHARVPAQFTADRKLGNWVSMQRHLATRGDLLPARRARLEELAFEFKLKARADWAQGYARAVAFHTLHGHARIPARYDADRKLASWANNQRAFAALGKMRPERRARLEQIGFVFALRSSRWEEMFQALLAFAREHGHSCVPAGHVRAGVRLGMWVGQTRQSYRRGRLSASRIQRLEAIGFQWRPRSVHWQKRYAAVKEFGQRHGHYRMNPSPLGQWLWKQRRWRRLGQLDPKRARLLDAIGC